MFGGISAGIGVVFGLFALGMFLFYKKGVDKKKKLMESGRYVMADIVDIDVNVNQTVMMGSKEIPRILLYVVTWTKTDRSIHLRAGAFTTIRPDYFGVIG